MKTRKQKAYQKGLYAESLAVLHLMARGYKILARRYKCKSGEIDIIALRDEFLVFVEVKARKTEGEALESITPRNQKRIEQAALYYLSQNAEYADYAMRFDVITFSPPFSLYHLDNAWQARS